MRDFCSIVIGFSGYFLSCALRSTGTKFYYWIKMDEEGFSVE